MGIEGNSMNRLILCLLGLFGALSATAHADVTVITNVRGYTSTDDGLRTFEALAFEDGRVVATGDDSLASRYPAAERIDGKGRTLLPGLTDAHAHLSSLGELQVQLDLFGVDSLEESVAMIGAFADESPGSGWVLGRGWNQVLWEENAFPTAADIDAVVADRPVFLRRVDGHAAWANTKALEMAGIDRDTEDPIGGKILRDENGDATGTLIDNAMDIVQAVIPETSKEELRVAYEAAVRAVNALGITGVHDAGVSVTDVEVLMSMADEGALDLRMYGMISGAGENLDAIGKPIIAYGNDHLDVRSVKLYQDGALGSRGAAMLEPYSDDPENLGLPFWTQDELNAQVAKSTRMGFQVGIHAIGDRGNRMSLNAFEAMKGEAKRPRIEHSQIVALSDIPRFAELGVIAAMQPVHATSDMNMAVARIGEDRILGAYAWRKMLNEGVVIAAGSDFPVELVNPFYGLYAAVTRQSRDGMPPKGWYPGEVLTREEALHSFTLGAAYGAFQEERLGSLEKGKWADFIIVDRDYFEVPVDEIDDTVVLETWIGGRKVYDAKDGD